MIPDEQLDFEACVRSGQVFRFRLEDEVWRGVDGRDLIEARKVDGGWIVSSSPDGNAWMRFLRIDEDLVSIQGRLIEREPRMAPIIARIPGLRTLRPQRADETLFSFLCTPNNHMSRIVGMAGFLARKGPALADGHYIFPEVGVIAEIDEEELRANGFGYRGGTIPKVAAEVLRRGAGWLEDLTRGTYEQSRKELMSLPGVGPKLADCVCLFGLHFDQAVPIDTHVWKCCSEWYVEGAKGVVLSPARYEEARARIADTFGSLSGWAQQYVFFDRFLSYRRTK